MVRGPFEKSIMGVVQKAVQKSVCEANDLVFAKYNLSLNALKILAITISDVEIQDTQLYEVEFTRKELFKLLNFTSKNKSSNHYKAVLGACRELAMGSIDVTNILIKLGQIREKDWSTQTRWMDSDFDYNKQKYVFRLNNKLLPLVTELRRLGFTKYKLLYLLKLKSVQAIKFYRLYKQTQNLVVRGRREFTINQIKDILGISRATKSYLQQPVFKKMVLDRLLLEINNVTDINARIVSIKEGNKVVRYRLDCQDKSAEELDILDSCGLPKL